MSVLPDIEGAIHARAPIRFRYMRPGKTEGWRVGNPHAVFIKRLKSGVEKAYLHLWQTEGASDSAQALPSWRQYFLNDIHVVETVPEGAPFDVCSDYNPTYYEHPICKI
jgi:hypothetical protein